MWSSGLKVIVGRSDMLLLIIYCILSILRWSTDCLCLHLQLYLAYVLSCIVRSNILLLHFKKKSISSVLLTSIFKGTNRKLPFFICRLNSEWLWFVHSSMHLGAAIARNWSQCGMKLVKRWEVLGLQ